MKNVEKEAILTGGNKNINSVEKGVGSGEYHGKVASPIIGTSNEGVTGEVDVAGIHMEENKTILNTPFVFKVESATVTKQDRKKFKVVRSRGKEPFEMKTNEGSEERGLGKRKAVMQRSGELNESTHKKAKGSMAEVEISDLNQVVKVWGVRVTVEIRDLNVEIVSFSAHHIEANVCDASGVPSWKLVGVYGWLEATQKHRTWDLIRSIHAGCSIPMLYVGDFNKILGLNEKSGWTIRGERRMDGFRNALEDYGLRDLGYKGSIYTWEKGTSINILMQERLDR
uniref:Endonuclease/exonuclease/phosphatase domain-containing protein n=1 Tax=Chenopodium quinoa TaxID=63459 RepID=A0A803KMP6_CHEQI